MGSIDDSERGIDAGTKLLKSEPPRKADASPKTKSAVPAEPIGSITKSKIDNVQRGIDAGTKLLKSEPSADGGAGRKEKANTRAKPKTAEHVNYPGTSGIKVWAFRPGAGNFVATGKASGWDYCFSFPKLSDLLETLKAKALNEQVANLSIVAHGDADGVVQLESLLTPKTIGGFKTQISELRSFLKPNGKLIFMSCIAGKGEEGSALLTALSNMLPGIYTIAFTIYGGYSGNFVSTPGQIWEDQYGNGKGSAMPKDPKWMTEHSIFSKWALNGKIIKFPQDEQALRPNKTCANPACPGHLRGVDQCDAFP